MSKIEQIFSAGASRKVQVNDMKALLREIDYLSECPEGSRERYHEVVIPINSRYSHLTCVPTVKELMKNHFWINNLEARLLRKGINTIQNMVSDYKVAEWGPRQQSDLYFAGNCISSAFNTMNEKEYDRFFRLNLRRNRGHGSRSKHQLPNWVSRDQGTAIARKLFKAGLKYK